MAIVVTNPKVAVTTAIMSVYGSNWDHRTDGPVDPPYASVAETLYVFNRLLRALQENGVVPGTKLLIRIETMEDEIIE